MSVLLALVVLYFLPTIIRGFALGLLIVLAVVAVAHAQQTRTTCYDFRKHPHLRDLRRHGQHHRKKPLLSEWPGHPLRDPELRRSGDAER